ncbi:hypothetical protein ACTWQF_26430 [Streptomyces sp. 8N114]|uniref:hypothetical protein n=1 Tax=Streptomyces sp. 8N114 TaxID=3457419 RepID=UPI003FD69456
MIALAQNRGETEIATVLSNVLVKHRQDKHAAPHHLTLVRGEQAPKEQQDDRSLGPYPRPRPTWGSPVRSRQKDT